MKNIGAELRLAPYSKITNNVAKEATCLEYLGLHTEVINPWHEIFQSGLRNIAINSFYKITYFIYILISSSCHISQDYVMYTSHKY